MSDEANPQLLEVGRIGKAHGLKGEVVVDFMTDRVADRTEPGAELWSEGVRFEVISARPHQSKWLVRFVGVTDRNEAERLRGKSLEALAIVDPDAFFVHEMVGMTIIDQHGTDHGPVVAMIENPASDLMELADGRLVPMNFIVARDDSSITVSVPTGLLDDIED